MFRLIARVVTKKSFFVTMLNIVMVIFYSKNGFADTQNIGQVAANITASLGNLAKLATAGAYVGGFGFAVAAILKFKAHKDNPTQIPVGTPIALLLIATAMIFMPTVFGVTGATLFGASADIGGISGVTTFSH